MIKPLPRYAESAIMSGVGRLLQMNVLPHRIFREVGRVKWQVDHSMDYHNGILGSVSWFRPLTVRLSPILSMALQLAKWDRHNMAELAQPVSVAVHELTHLQQIDNNLGLTYPFLAVPIVREFTIERWADENQRVACDALESAR